MWSNTAKGQEFMEQLRTKKDELEHLVHKSLKQDVDYMMLEGGKFCLLKAGAEKLCDYFGFRVQYELVQSSGNHVTEQAMYIIKAILINWRTGEKVSEGLGLASSQETRYKTEKSMDVANSILKIAKKRAMVDAVISAVGGSFLFTQDLEDSRNDNQDNNQRRNATAYQQKNSHTYQQSGSNNQTKNARNGYSSKGKGKPASNGVKATASQINYIETLVSSLRINRMQLCSMLEEQFGVNDYRGLSKNQASEFIKVLKADSSQAS